ncbi:Competence-induced protein CoiA-like protein, partial [Candidatus Magnetomorum sp. HK-1]
EELRYRGQNNQLNCPVCDQPVLVKAGEVKQWHFAHRDTGSCPLRNESESVLRGRIILYRWLSNKYPAKVSLEKTISDIDLPRPFDCYIETDTGNKFAYWILESGFRSHGKIKKQFIWQDIHIQMIFLSNMIRKGPDDKSTLLLTPTERSFAYRSEYNQLYHSTSDSALTYLDLTTQYLHTFRGLFLIHKPHIFAYKTKLSEQIVNVLISPKNGEFVYPGEYEKLKSLRNMSLKSSDNNNTKKNKSYRRSIKKKRNYHHESISNGNHLDYLTKTYPCIKCGKQTNE